MRVNPVTLQQAGHLLIDAASREDVDRILQIEQESFSAPWSRKMFEVELEGNPFGHLYIARPADRHDPEAVIGYVCFWVVFEEFRLMNLAVAASARRRSVGRELLQRALALGRLQGATRALLEVRMSNAAALALYEQAGFRRTAVREKYYTKPVEDAVLMERDPLTGDGE